MELYYKEAWQISTFYGRIFNLFAYTIMVIGIFKILPFKKNVFFTVYMTPLLVLLAGYYSVDGICVGIIGLFIAYCLKLYNDQEDIGKKQIIKLAILFILILLSKSMAYTFICLLLFILPVVKIIKQNKKTMAIATIAIIGVALLIIATKMFGSGLDKISDPRSSNTNAKEQIIFMIQNPIKVILVAAEHTKESILNFNWLHYFQHSGEFGKASCIFVLQFIFIFYVAISDNSARLKLKEKSIMLLSFFTIFFTSSFMLYISFTAVGTIGINGYQPRYLFPILPLLLIVMNNNNVQNDKNEREKISIILSVFMIMSMIGAISVL